jgi:hypothetical protein
MSATIPASAAQAFAQDGYVVVRELIDPALARLLCAAVESLEAGQALRAASGGPTRAAGIYGDGLFETMLDRLRPSIEAATGRRLHPTYSYARMYRLGDALIRHRDRAACEISVSLCVGQAPADPPWPLFVEGAAGAYAAKLLPGDALVYRGIDLPHWREPFAGERAAQAFLHYVDADGPHADQKFDGRAALGAL